MTGHHEPARPKEPGTWRSRNIWVVVLAAILVAIGIVDLLTIDAPIFAFTLLPVAASSVLGRPWITAALSVLSLITSGIILILHHDTSPSSLTRLLLVGIAGIVATGVGVYVRRAEAARDESFRHLREREEQYRLLAENSVDVIACTDLDGRLTYVSPAVVEVLGFAPDELVGRHWKDLLEPVDALRIDQTIAEIVGDPTRTTSILTQATRKDGALRWFSATVRLMEDDDDEPIGLIATCRDVTGEVAARRELSHRAQFDELTEVLNRREAFARLHHASTRPRVPGDQAAVLFVDLDRFKDVNDHNGHAAGDDVLRTLTRRMNETVRAGDIVARMGGDEFVVLLDGLHDMAEAQAIADKLRLAARAPIETLGGTVRTSISVGIAPLLLGQTVDDLLAIADHAMYEAKKSGGDRVVTLATHTG